MIEIILLYDEAKSHSKAVNLKKSMDGRIYQVNEDLDTRKGVIIEVSHLKEFRSIISNSEYSSILNINNLIIRDTSKKALWLNFSLLKHFYSSTSKQFLITKQNDLFAIPLQFNEITDNKQAILIYLYRKRGELIEFQYRFNITEFELFIKKMKNYAVFKFRRIICNRQTFHDEESKELHDFMRDNSEIIEFDQKHYPNFILSKEMKLADFIDSLRDDFNLNYLMTTVLYIDDSFENASLPEQMIINSPAAAFESDFIGKGEADLEQLIFYISSIGKNVDIWKLYAPIMSICQSSGSGKSKIAAGLCKAFNCAYVVLRYSSDDSGFPKATPLSNIFQSCAREEFQNIFVDYSQKSNNIGRFLMLILAILEDYYKQMMFELRRTDNSETIVSLRQKMFDSYYIEIFDEKGIRINRHPEIETIFSNYAATDLTSKQLIDKIVEVNAEIRKFHEQSIDEPFVLIVDEASILAEKKCGNTNKFLLLRRAAHLLRSLCKIVLVTLGTNSDVTDLNPSVGRDSSREPVFHRILSPFIMPRTWDIFAESTSMKNIVMNKKFLCDGAVLWLLFSMGRPLWSSLDFSTILNTAVQKLTNNSTESGQSYLACWMIRTGLTASPSSVVITKYLMKSLMATLFYISPDFERMYIGYPSEPVLALAAKQMAQSDDFFDKFVKFVEMQAIDKGRITEAMAAEICLRAISFAVPIKIDTHSQPSELKLLLDSQGFLLQPRIPESRKHITTSSTSFKDPASAQIAANYYHVTNVEFFVKSLYNSDVLSGFLPSGLRDGYINATHFVPIHRNFCFEKVFGKGEKEPFNPTAHPIGRKCNIIDYSLLHKGLLRQCAYILPTSYYASDLIIPVCAEGYSSTMPLLTYIAIQVKSTSPNLKEIISKMASRHHYVPRRKYQESPDASKSESVKVEVEVESEEHLNFIHSNCLVLQMSLESLDDEKENTSSAFSSKLEIFDPEKEIEEIQKKLEQTNIAQSKKTKLEPTTTSTPLKYYSTAQTQTQKEKEKESSTIFTSTASSSSATIPVKRGPIESESAASSSSKTKEKEKEKEKKEKVVFLSAEENEKRLSEAARLKEHYKNSYGQVEYVHLQMVKSFVDAQIFPCSLYTRSFDNSSLEVLIMHFMTPGCMTVDSVLMFKSEGLMTFKHLWSDSCTSSIRAILANDSFALDAIVEPYRAINTADVANSLLNKAGSSFTLVDHDLLESRGLSPCPDPSGGKNNYGRLYKFD